MVPRAHDTLFLMLCSLALCRGLVPVRLLSCRVAVAAGHFASRLSACCSWHCCILCVALLNYCSHAGCKAAAATRPTPFSPSEHPPAQWPLSKDVLEGTFGRSTRDRTVAMTLAADSPASSSWSAWLPCSMNLHVKDDTSSGS